MAHKKQVGDAWSFSPSRRTLIHMGGAAMVAAHAWPALAKSWPARNIKIVLGFAAGGPLDVVTRLVAAELSHELGVSVVVENKAGASGQLATDMVAAAPADGYTLLSTASTFIVNPLMKPGPQPDPLKDFEAISLMARLPTVLVVPHSFPANSLSELIAVGKQRSLNYSSAGNGGPGHLAGELLSQTVGVPMVHVAFRGAAPALMEVIAGRIDFSFYTMTGLKEQVDSGKLKPLAVTAAERHHLFPDVPTMTEAGVPGFEQVGAWFGLVAPAGTPRHVVDLLNQKMNDIIHKEKFTASLASLGVLPGGGSPAEFQNFLANDSARWEGLIQKVGIAAS